MSIQYVKILYAAVLFLTAWSCSGQTFQQPNIVFISVDDLRPQLGCYGFDYMKTPNLDKLASQSTVFKNHFTQVPTCGASRYSMLTGKYPTHPSELRNNVIIEKITNQKGSNQPETFIHLLKKNGYYTSGIGKISHSADGYVYGYNEPVSTQRELPLSWDTLQFDTGPWETGWDAFFAYSGGQSRTTLQKKVKPYEMASVPDSGYPDGLTAHLSIKELNRLNKLNRPFFLGVGFFKPHLPFNAPSKYWNLYQKNNIPLSPNPQAPANVNPVALNNSGEFNNGYQKAEEHPSAEHPVSKEYARRLRHAHFAAISYIDAQIGKVINELDRLNLTENTIIIVWGDHGWHLGDHSIWGKHTLFERALKSALIIKTPGTNKSAGIADGLVESLDIYPTLCELCNINPPEDLDGNSLVPLLNRSTGKGKKAVLGFWHNGYTVRNENFRLMYFPKEKENEFALFDHQNDPYETTNIADSHTEVVQEMKQLLKPFKE
ncbi:sulfatase [Marinilabilia sp.]